MSLFARVRAEGLRKQARGILLALVAGACLGLGVTLPHMAGVFLVGMFLFLWQAGDRSISLGKTATLGFLSGLVFMGAAFSWIFLLHPLSWSGIHNEALSLVLVTVMWTVVVVGNAAGLSLVAAAVKWLGRGTPIVQTIIAASVWILAEKLRAFIAAGIFYAPAVHLVPHFNLHTAGYALSEVRVFAHLLPLGGEALSSFAAAAFVFALCTLVRSGRAAAFLGIVVVFVALQGTLPPPNQPLHGKPVTLGIVTGAFKPDFSPPAIRQRVRDIRNLLNQEEITADLLVLPENSLFLREEVLKEGALPLDIAFKAEMIIDSAPSRSGHNLYFYSHTGRTDQYKKIVLMPQGEYYMSWEIALAKLFGADAWLALDTTRVTPSVGSQVLAVPVRAGLVVGGLLCAEAVSPYLYRSLVEKGTMVLFNPASHAVFHNSSILRRQMEAVNRTRAIELDRYIVVAGNMTDSLIISNQGEIVAQFEPVYPARLDLTVVQTNTHRTPFARTGEWIVYLALLIVGGAAVVSLRSGKEE